MSLQQTSPEVAVPSRFRADEERGARLGRPLRLITRLGEPDEELMDRLAAGFMAVDEPGARLARALRAPSDDPGKVTMRQLRQALADGIESVEDAPTALKDFFTTVQDTPDWVDHDLIDQGAAVIRRFGRNAADVLLQLSLIGGYRFGGPPDLLVATGGLVGDATLRRLGETQQWTVAVAQDGALRPGGEGVRLTLHVRAMHALVNETFAGPGGQQRWDIGRWGMPINQSDQAATLGLFSGVLLLGCRALGVRVTREDSRAVMHLWRYVGWLMGVDEQWLVETEAEQHRLNYHVLLAQAGPTDAGAALSQSIIEAQRRLHVRRPVRLRRRYAEERLLSMLTIFLGPTSMRELGLPMRPPWATPLVIAANVVRYHVLGRTAFGRRVLEAWGDRVQREVLRRHFGPEAAEVGQLTDRGRASGG
ncbi:oxygenase MpaB family protein [Aeromicrobium sp. CTD01-1L150]|uniref:oxygenase MpaB family protein n=1 Tax=Aeromicrobium sp. CTD01-1L150 TaxID=3341830 RepID=UPI0035BFB37F